MQPSSRHKCRGLTLPETLISTAIFGLVLLGTYTLLAFAIRWNGKMTDSIDTYQQALRASTKMSYDLGTGAQVSFIYEVDGFAFASARADTGPHQLSPSGELLWQKHIIYYLDGGVLYRNEVDFPTPAPGPPATPSLATLRTQMTGRGQVMAERVSDLSVESGSGASIRLRVFGERDPSNSITLENRVTFRQ